MLATTALTHEQIAHGFYMLVAAELLVVLVADIYMIVKVLSSPLCECGVCA